MAKILITLHSKENEKLLVKTLSKRHKIITQAPEENISDNCDLWIIDGVIIDKEWRRIKKIKTQEQAFLPILLAVNRKDVGFITRSLWKIIDELILMPIEKLELFARIENLLIRRELSLHLEELVEKRTRELEKVNMQLAEEIEEHKQTEKALEESEKRFRLLAENAQDIIFRFEIKPRQGFTYVSPAAEKITGYSPDEFYADPDIGYKIAYPEDKPLLEVYFQNETMFNKPMVLRWVRKDGTIIWIEQINTPIRDEKGEIIAIEGIARDVTQSKKSEETLRKLFRAIEFSPASIFITDYEGNIEYVNPKFTEVTGYTYGEALGKNPRILKSGFHSQEFYKNLWETIKSGNEWRGEFLNKRKNGELYWEKASISPIFNENGKITHFVAVKEDITQQKEKIKLITQYSYIFEESLNEIYIFDFESLKFLHANRAALENLGYNLEELQKLTPVDIEPEFNHNTFNELIQPLITDEKKNLVFETIHKRKNGTTYDVEVHLQLLKIEGENIFVSIVLDITGRKIAEKKIQESERFLNTLFDSVAEAILTISMPDRKIIKANKGVSIVFDYSPEELIGKSPIILYEFERDFIEYGEKIKNAILNNESEVEAEVQMLKKDGTKIWCDLHTTFIKHDGEVTHIITLIRDITNEKKMIEELIEAKEKAEEMNRVKSYFFANMSHELRTPFVGIKGYAELLSEILPDEEHRKMAKIILNSSERMLDTLTKLLNVTKLEFEKPKIILSDINIKELLTDRFTLFKVAAEKKGLIASLNLFPNRAENDRPEIIKSNEGLLREIVDNLLNNAIKFTEQGKVELSADIEAKGEQEYLVIKVSDTGIGIPEDKKELIFQEFRQVSEGLNRNFEGTGLGLTITKKFVELLGGKIYIDSEEGVGSTFFVELPIGELKTTIKEKIEERGLEEKEESRTVEIPEITNKQMKRILYVEDEETARSLIKVILSRYYVLDFAKNSIEALEKVKLNKYDAFLIDINLRVGLDGVELMELLKSMPEYKNTPFIALTAYAANSDKKEFLSRGFTHYISKPFSSKELVRLLSEIFKNE